jgi:hypothetical protein
VHEFVARFRSGSSVESPIARPATAFPRKGVIASTLQIAFSRIGIRPLRILLADAEGERPQFAMAIVVDFRYRSERCERWYCF